MTQGAGQGPVLRTATLRDFRVPGEFRVPAYVDGIGPADEVPASGPPEAPASEWPADAMGGALTGQGAEGAQTGAGSAGEHAWGGQLGDVAIVHPEAPGAHHLTSLASEFTHPAADAAHLLAPATVDPTAARHATPEHTTVAHQTHDRPLLAHPGAGHTTLAHMTPDHTATTPLGAGATEHTGHAAVPPAATGSFEAPGAPMEAAAPTEPDGYTPTQRDLPIVNRGDTLQMPVRPATDPGLAPAPGSADGPGPLFVVGDVHGYLDQLIAALQAQGIVDAEARWIAGNTRLWFLGDFTDRGPDGIGVIDTVMRLSAEAAAAGGYCKALMGNHELLLLGAKRFGDTPVSSGAGTATFQAAWLLNGGQKTDMDRLQDHHLQWMSRLDAMEEEDGHLLVHSDTTSYLDYGDSIEAVNDTVRETLTRNDANECWDLFRKFTKRFAFRDANGSDAVRELLSAYGGTRIVHGHSPIPYLLGEVGSEEGDDAAGPVVEGPHVYADGLAIAMDGGVTMAGKLLVCPLPLHA